MAATAVYEGVNGGDLFAGIKLFILQKVPLRNTWKEMILANGGEIVQIDKQADIIIADHKHHSAPAGSTSWKWIDDSVKKGRLEKIEDHPAGPDTDAVRATASRPSGSKGRTPFTGEDDRVLMKWCSEAERAGLSLMGNEIYKQLEQRNSRHTFHSWRDRWIKHLSHLERPALPENEEEVEDEPDRQGPISAQAMKAKLNRNLVLKPLSKPAGRRIQVSTAPAHQRTSNKSATSHGALLRSSTPVVQSPNQPFRAKSSGGNVFTDEDTEILEAEYDAILAVDEALVIDAWMAFSSAHPRHTPQEWRNYFQEFLLPRKQAEIAKKVESKQVSSTQNISRPTPAEANNFKQRSHSRGQGERIEGVSVQNASCAEKIQKSIDPALIDEKIFMQDLRALADSLELTVEFRPKICGKTISLFRIWQVVKSSEFGGFEAVNGDNLWPQVASRLDFNIFRHSLAPTELRNCYSEILADFENARAEYEEECEQEIVEVSESLELTFPTAIDDTEASRKEEQQEDEFARAQSFPPKLLSSSSSKRGLGVDRSNRETVHAKRQRVEKDKGKETEIPATPEHIMNDKQVTQLSLRPSPLKSSGSNMLDDEDSGSIESPIKPISFHSLGPPRPRIKVAEPETQDFHFETEIDPEEEEEDSDGLFVGQSSPPIPVKPKGRRGSSAARNALHTSSHADDSSTQSQTASQSEAALQAFITSQVALGYPAEIVYQALGFTTLEYGKIIEVVMESLLNGEGVPQNTAGVWTTEDDEALGRSFDGTGFQRILERILEKHGAKRIRARKSYLQNLKDVEEEGVSDWD